MRAQGWRIDLRWLAPASLLLLYLGSYAALRTSRTLIRTGRFHNCHWSTGGLHPSAGWMDSGVRRGDGSRAGAWVEHVFAPVIFLESTYWDTLGRQQRCREISGC